MVILWDTERDEYVSTPRTLSSSDIKQRNALLQKSDSPNRWIPCEAMPFYAHVTWILNRKVARLYKTCESSIGYDTTLAHLLEHMAPDDRAIAALYVMNHDIVEGGFERLFTTQSRAVRTFMYQACCWLNTMESNTVFTLMLEAFLIHYQGQSCNSYDQRYYALHLPLLFQLVQRIMPVPPYV